MLAEWLIPVHKELEFLKAASVFISRKWLGSQIKSVTYRWKELLWTKLTQFAYIKLHENKQTNTHTKKTLVHGTKKESFVQQNMLVFDTNGFFSSLLVCG